MNHPTEKPQPMARAHVRDAPHGVSLRLGDMAVITTLTFRNDPYAKRAMDRYEESAKRINAELDETGSMNMSRALEIAHEVFEVHWRELDDRP